MLGACTVKRAFGLEKVPDPDELELENDAPFTRGARGLLGLEKLGARNEGTRNPLNGFLNLN